MNARDIIERLARLDEAGVETAPAPTTKPKPTTRPGTAPSPKPNPRPHNPYDPYQNPRVNPRPKAGVDDDMVAIRDWLSATQQPMKDWEWDGENLRVLLDDGSVETYDRQQLDKAGVFGGSDAMAFAESKEEAEDEAEEEAEIESSLDNEEEETEEEEEEETEREEKFAIKDQDEGDEFSVTSGPSSFEPSDPVSGPEGCSGLDATMCGIMGVEGSPEEAPEADPAEKLTQAISDMAQAIMGLVGTDGSAGANPTGELALIEPDVRPDTDYPADQLEKGEEVEAEHAEDEDVEKKIAKDHMDENPEDYSGDEDDDQKEKE